MKIKQLLFVFAFLLVGNGLFAQETFAPSDIIQGTFLGKTIPLRDFPTYNGALNYEPRVLALNESTTEIVEHEGAPTILPDLQTETGRIQVLPPEQNFIGASAAEAGGVFPPDPTGAVGPNHYVHSVNILVKIFDKTGNLEVGPVDLGAFLGDTSFGDPIVLYDQLADRWVVSGFGNLNQGNTLLFGVSETNDPGGAYNVYSYNFSALPDYPHYGVWHDGYYGTINLGGFDTLGMVMDRDAMLAGEPNAQILVFQLPGVIVNPLTVKSPEPASLLGTTIDTSQPGYITYLQDDGWTGAIPFDHLKVWEIVPDWDDINNSTISAPLEIPTDPFDAGEIFGNGNGALRQPGTSQRLAGHGGIVSFPAPYRDFGTHKSWLVTFNTFIDGAQTGGIRWIELRTDGTADWSIFQEGTYSIADGHSRLMSSSAIDAAGNISLAYTTGSTSLAPSLRYTGRFDGDPLGQMTVAEEIIIDGPGVRTNSNRYGDYSHMTMDPDNFTFWHTADYFSSNNQWRTQVASWRISGGFANDVGVIDIVQPENGLLTANETVEVAIRNFGTDVQTSIPLELRVDGVLVASETFTGNLGANDVTNFTFAQTVDLSIPEQIYTIEVTTALAGDEFVQNDPSTKEVQNLLANDIGSLEITAPMSGPDLSDMETISVNIRNFGANDQSNFDVQYAINGDPAVVETFAGTLNSEDEVVFDFTTQADFSQLGTYTIVVSTSLAGDQQANNDEVTLVIEKTFCQPDITCSLGDGFRQVTVAEIDNVSDCEGYGDFRDQIANIAPGSSTEITFTTGFGNQFVRVWIDYNDDFSFTTNELVVNNFVIAPGQQSPGTFTGTTTFVVPGSATVGEHIMRVKSNRNSPVPNDACEETNIGETEDYTANIGTLGVNDALISDSELIVTSLANNQFQISLRSDFEEAVYVGVFNLLGQELGLEKSIPRINGTYVLDLDMSKMSSGVYLLRVGGQTTTSYKTARIIVQ